ncbi:hypothetical protein BCR42DRAFT_417495 [Absidia repens]|uniref:Uncharacterized protein n=1 Tax=Absidia repens TaxID=90262 RepID=A0A1X2IDW0_9FUNG|nr:hypothetical protein BCR42DRAFT_417495 [Absidia repens]
MIEMIKIKTKTPPSLSDPMSKQGQHHQHKTGRIQKERERERLLVSSTFNIVAFSFMLCLTVQTV